MIKKLLRFLSYVLVAAAASIATFYVIVYNLPDTPYSKLVEMENIITERFIGEADKTKMEDAAAEAMVDALGDRWSYYISAEDYASYVEQMANAYVGIGITISMKEDESGLNVLLVSAGSPALEAGIVAGDVITHVEGQGVAELGLAETKNRVRGEEGTQVVLTVVHDGVASDITVTRRQIETEVATLQMLPEDIALIKIANFDSRCAEETLARIDEAMIEGAEAIIFDVRNNPGGYKDELVKILDYLLPEGPLFISEDYTGASYTDSSDEGFLDIPMVVLQNEESYSAAEFFGAALREYEAAIIVGTPTVGKGYFQNTLRMKDGSAIGLSVGKYYTPKGISLAGVGITPDILVEVDEETAAAIYAETLPYSEDIQVLTAIEALKK